MTERLLEGAMRALGEAGIDDGDSDRCFVLWVPGAFELALGALELIDSEGVDAVVALGCVIRGETDHYRYVASASARGIQEVSLRTRVPVAFGVLTTDDVEQALARSGDTPESNKGFEAAMTALEMAVTSRRLRKRRARR